MPKQAGNAGFTLIEMMIVTEIIAILVTMAIPTLLRQRIQTNEAAAVQNLHTLCTGEVTYNAAKNEYGTLEQMSEGAESGTGFLSQAWYEGIVKSEYVFEVIDATADNFRIRARPEAPGRSGVRTYFVDESSFVWWEE